MSFIHSIYTPRSVQRFRRQESVKAISIWLVTFVAMLLMWLFAYSAKAQLQLAPATWYQPCERFADVKAANIKTICGYAATVDMDTWCAGLKRNGLHAWCQYTAQTAAYFSTHESNLPLLLGWIALPDEPNGGGNATAGQVADEVRSIKRAWPTMLVMVNLDGRPFRYASPDDSAAYCRCGADVIAFDVYPLNQADIPIAYIGVLLDKIHQYAPGITVLVCLEDCNQDLALSTWLAGTPQGQASRGPTLDEIKQEVEVATKHGAAGVIWFEQDIGAGWIAFFDPMKFSPGVLEALPGINNALILSIVPATQPAVAPLEGKQVIVDGVSYRLTAR